MKHNWTYKKLGEVADVVMGQSPDGSSLNDSKGIEFHQGKVAFGEKFLESSHCYTTAPTKLAKGHSLLLCVRAPVGILNITDREICIGRGLCAVNAKDDAINEFLYYALRSKQEYFEKNSTGSTFKAISSALVKGALLPIPSLDDQLSIVRELDGINHLIDLQEEQLHEYDHLAQALFYSTFGDPLTNPKGWEVKKLGEVAIIRDGSHNPPKGVDEPTEYRMLSSQNIFDNLIDYSKGVRYLSKESYELEHKRTNLKSGDVLLTIVGTIGRTCIVSKEDSNITLQRSVAVLSPKDDILSIYLNRLLFVIGEELQYESRGVAQKGIYLGQLSKTQIPVPPLDLQQSFAAQIEAIEQQKALVRKSLEETRTLLAARMQYYFE